jgi:hypothetical protein
MEGLEEPLKAKKRRESSQGSQNKKIPLLIIITNSIYITRFKGICCMPAKILDILILKLE